MIAILGCGRIGEALLAGLLGAGWKDIVVTSRTDARTTELRERHGVEATTDNAAAVAQAELVVVAVKPQDIDALLAEVGRLLTAEQTVLSIAAAIPTAQIEARIAPGVPVVRAMPNAPSIVHEGMAGICAGAHAGEANLALAENALAHLGRVVRVPESAMDAVTALSGSGPAYFALLAEAMIEAGILLGVSREISTTLVVQTMLGTAKQLRDLGMHPVELRESVTSPGGTTIAAIRELEQAGVRAALLNDVQPAAVHRMRGELGRDAGAEDYDRELGDLARFDLVLLGLGPDGHVASLYPDQPTLDENERRVLGAEAKLEPYVDRITLTLPMLRAAHAIVFLVAGDDKADAAARAFGSEPSRSTPGSLVRALSGTTTAVLDRAAAKRLKVRSTFRR